MRSFSITNLVRGNALIAVAAIVALSIYLLFTLTRVQSQFGSVVDRNVSLMTTVSDLRYYTVTYRRFALDYGLTSDEQQHKQIVHTIGVNDKKVNDYAGDGRDRTSVGILSGRHFEQTPCLSKTNLVTGENVNSLHVVIH